MITGRQRFRVVTVSKSFDLLVIQINDGNVLGGICVSFIGNTDIKVYVLVVIEHG